MAKITDKMRLDHLEALHQESCPQEWVGVLYDGTIILDEPSQLDSQYELVSNARPKIRQAIDAAIRNQTKRGGK